MHPSPTVGSRRRDGGGRRWGAKSLVAMGSTVVLALTSLGATPASAHPGHEHGTDPVTPPAAVEPVAAEAAEPPDMSKFQKVILAQGTHLGEVMELTVAPDGRVFFITRFGDISLLDPATGSSEIIMNSAELDVWSGLEDGGLGITLDPDFEENNFIWVYYAPNPKAKWVNRLARLTLTQDELGRPRIQKSSEKILLEVGTQREACCHSAGSLQFDKNGILHLSTGDNTSSSDNDGYSSHDERPNRYLYDAQKSSGNTNDLRGSILRVIPRTDDDGDIDPITGDGISYDIPAGNLFGEGGQFPDAKYPNADPAKTRPEIYVMGLRNPYRIGIDMDTDTLYWGEVGPDANDPRQDRGPERYEEFNRTTEAMNGGWPYCIGEANPLDAADYSNGGAYVDWDFVANRPRTNADGSIKRFPCSNPDGMTGINDSPNNTGLQDLPPATNAWIPYRDDGGKYGFGGNTAIGGKVYRQSQNTLAKDTAFPAHFEGSYFMAEMSRGWIKEVRMDEDGTITSVNDFMSGFTAPGEIEFGPDGSMYVVEYGTGFFSGSPATKIVRIDYAVNGLAPVAVAAATPSEGGVPLTVAFSSAGSNDPDGGALTYAWDFNGDGSADSTSANPSHTFTAAGDYPVRLTVTDPTAKSASAQVIVNVGNTAPKVQFQQPLAGGFFDWNDDLAFDIDVTDAEETVNCEQVFVQEGLGHDSHAHPNGSTYGCEGVLRTAESADHGADANTYGVLMASYADHGGNNGANAPLTGSAQIILQPKVRQAEHTLETNRRGVGQTGYDDKSGTRPGGGGLITGVSNTDYLMFTPMSLSGMTAIDVVYSGNPQSTGKIEVRAGSATGTIVATANLTQATQGQYFYATSRAQITSRAADAGGQPLFFVYNGPGQIQLDEFRFIGRGIAANVSPVITSATATPQEGTAPHTVNFAAAATDDDGDAITYTWDFGVPGTDNDTADGATASWTYTEGGLYTATVTATDATGKAKSRAVDVNVRKACTTAPTPAEGFSLLFDGTDLSKWKQSGPGRFFVDDCTLTSQGGLGMLWYADKKFADYTVKLQYKLSRDTDNSGVFTRFPDPGNDPYVAVNQGHEIQIREGVAGDGEDQKTGSVYNFDREDTRNSRPLGEWNDYEITVVGQTYTMTLNGQVVNTYHSDGSRGIDGFIGLQNHGNADTVVFRDIQIKELTEQKPFVNKLSRTPAQGAAPLAVTFTVEGVDRQGDAISYEWNFGDGTPVSTTTTGSAQHTYTAGGARTATVTPIDAAGNRGTTRSFAAVTALVNPVSTSDAAPRCAQAPAAVTFTGNATDPQNQALTYSWNFGVAGGTSTEQNPTFTYTEPGIYTATVTVTDPDGNTGTQELVIEVLAQGDCGSPVNLAAFFNNDGISMDAAPGNGNFDGGGWMYAAETLPQAVRTQGGPVTLDGTTYVFGSPQPGQQNNVEARGQVIPLPAGKFDLLKVLGAAHNNPNGDATGDVVIRHTDGTTRTLPLRFSDWAQTARFGEDETVFMPHRHAGGGDTGPAVRLFTQNLSLDPSKDVASITLPNQDKFHVFAITAVKGGSGPDVAATEPVVSSCSRSDDFAGDALNTNRWSVLRSNPNALKLQDGNLVLTTTSGELQSSAQNIVLQRVPNGGFTAVTKITIPTVEAGQQAGLTLENGSGTKLLKLALNDKGGSRWVEFLRIINGANDFTGSWNGGNLPADFGSTIYLRLTSQDGKSVRGDFSKDGVTWTSAGNPRAGLGVNQRVGVYALHGVAANSTVADVDWFALSPETAECENTDPTVTVAADVTSGAAPLAVNLTATGADADGDELSYAWDFGDETTGEGATVAHTYTAAGTWTATVTVTDGQGGTASASVEIVVEGAGTGKTWIVDAVDNATGNYWVSRDTGTSEVTVQVGDTVEWQFGQATMAHDVSSRGSNWDPELRESRSPGGPPVRYTFTKPGVYEYWCSIHGATMTGTVIVEDTAEPTNRPPVATPLVDPRSGTAPLYTHFEARASDPDGDTLSYLWDFGTGEQSTSDHAHYTYTQAGTYTAKLTVSDGKGGEFTESYQIQVTGTAPVVEATATPTSGRSPLVVTFLAGSDRPDAEVTYSWNFGDGSGLATGKRQTHTYNEPGTYYATVTATDKDGQTGTDTVTIDVDSLPTVTATADPASGEAPLTVSLGAEVTTSGTFKSFADGTTTYPELTGAASMVRSRGTTVTTLSATGLKPGAAHMVHVHEESCVSNNGGAHFRFDRSQPFAEANEIWLPFTASAEGASGVVTVTHDRRADATARSIVIHDPDNMAKRIGCVDLKPSLDELTYTWVFGDGTTGEGADVMHTYTAAGEYLAEVTVSDGTSRQVKAAVTVTVGETEPVDTTAPVTTAVVSDTDPVLVTLTSTDEGSGVATIEYRLGGGDIPGGTWVAYGDPVSIPRTDQVQTVQFRATDVAGNVEETKSVEIPAAEPPVENLPTVTRASVASSVVTYGAPGTVAVTVTADEGAPSGGVALFVGETAVGTGTLVDGAAVVELVQALPVGTHLLQVRYAGDETHAGSASSLRLTVAKSAIAVTAQAKSVKAAVAPKVTVQAGTTTGLPVESTVTLTVRRGVSVTATATGTLQADGTVTVSLPKLPAGTYSVTVSVAATGNTHSGAVTTPLVVTS